MSEEEIEVQAGTSEVKGNIVVNANVEQITAESVTIQGGSAAQVNAQTVTVSGGGVQAIKAEMVRVSDGAIGRVEGQSVEVTDGAMGIVQAETVHVSNGAVGVAITQHAEVTDTTVFLLAANEVSGEAHVLVDLRAAVVMGVISGAIFGLVTWLLGRRQG